MAISRRSALVLCGCAVAVAGSRFGSRFRAVASDAPFLAEVAPGAFAHFGRIAVPDRSNGGDTSNAGVVVGRDAVAVIDTGGSPATGRALMAAIRTISDKPIRYVVNTHEHPDHVFGNGAFRTPDTIFAGHRNMPHALAERAEHYLKSYREQLGEQAMAEVEIVAPTLLIDEIATIDLGGRTLELAAWHPAAHTDCDLTVLDRATGTLFAGDLVFDRHIPVVDGSLKGFISANERLATMRVSRIVPGHGTHVLEFPGGLDDERRYLRTIAADARHAIAAGVSLPEAVRTIGAGERTHWSLFDEYNARNATVAFSELEWE